MPEAQKRRSDRHYSISSPLATLGTSTTTPDDKTSNKHWFHSSDTSAQPLPEMPFPRLRVFFLLLSILAFTVLTAYFSAASLYPDYDNPEETSMFSPTTSSFLFPPSAIISLTDDNNTFFISRPAAFGPSLPKHGLEGELFVLEEGQLACDDTPGWDTSATIFDLEQPPLVNPEEPDDGTDDALNPSPANDEVLNKQRTHADIESLQQSAEIEGKIVLVTRGGCGFLEKVLWAQRRGSIALIVGDYKRPGIGSGGLVTMYAKGYSLHHCVTCIKY